MRRGLRHRLIVGLELAVFANGCLVCLIFPASRFPILVVTGIAMVLVWIVGLIATAKIRSAMHRIRDVADAISQGDYHRRLDSLPDDETAKLAASLNRLACRLEQSAQEGRQLQEQLVQKEKLAVVGELAATVAHEINNPLDGLQNCARLMRRDVHDPGKSRTFLDLMDSGLYRIERIVKRLLLLARPGEAELTPVVVADIMQEAVSLLEPKASRNHVEITCALSTEEVWVQADRQQLLQALVNLMLNAIEAMPEGGCLALSVSEPEMDTGTVNIEVADSGVGIPAERLTDIFEPFFTTRAGHGGTGVGLSLVSRIVGAHRGRIDVTSTLGRGSRFRLTLPLAPSSYARSASVGQPQEAVLVGTGDA